MAHCCVANCYSSIKKKEPGVTFYSFPGRSYETELKKKWIIAIKRKNPDGSIWQPPKRSFVCNKHFIGGKRNVTPGHPSSVPSIFPGVNKKPSTETAINNKIKRFERFVKRRVASKFAASSNLSEGPLVHLDRPESPLFVNKSVQVAKNSGRVERDFCFHCYREAGCEVSTQCNIPTSTPLQRKQTTDFGSCPDSEDEYSPEGLHWI